MKMFWRIAAAIAVTALFVPASAQAACTPLNLAGMWQAYTYGGTTTVNATQCKLKINAAGTIANTTCITNPGNTALLTQGKATILVAAACTFKVQFKLAGAQYNVTHATLSKSDKDVGSGIGTFPTNGVLMFTMAKL